jgi:hypothetical protein
MSRGDVKMQGDFPRNLRVPWNGSGNSSFAFFLQSPSFDFGQYSSKDFDARFSSMARRIRLVELQRLMFRGSDRQWMELKVTRPSVGQNERVSSVTSGR